MTHDPLESAAAKLERAKQHFEDLQGRVTDYFAEKRYTTEIRFNSDTGWHDLTLVASGDLPREWSAVVGDGIQNLRNALDHVAWSFALKHAGGSPISRPRDVQFPIIEDAIKSNFKASNLAWASTAQSRFLDGVQPYHRPDPAQSSLAVLRKLSNQDKHEALHAVYANVPSDEFNTHFDWDQDALGALTQTEVTYDPENLLVAGVSPMGRIRFERSDPNAVVSMSAHAGATAAFGSPGWRVTIDDIAVIDGEVAGIVAAARQHA